MPRKKAPKTKQCNFRLSKKAREQLAKIAKDTGLNRTRALEAILDFHAKYPDIAR